MSNISDYLKFLLVNNSFGKENVIFSSNNKITLFYPCQISSDCTKYLLEFQPGVYQIELYGASGGGECTRYVYFKSKINKKELECKKFSNQKFNVTAKCKTDKSVSGAGGYVSGTISFPTETKAYLAIGGHGTLSPDDPNQNGIGFGGFNGGGYSKTNPTGDILYTAASGGGATDLRVEQNNLSHRILVAGGGGGSDDQKNELTGFGGAGGGEVAQGSQCYTDYVKVANQTYGFSFGFGEDGNYSLNENGEDDGEAAGAGGGWWGGFASHSNNGGAGGGSSYALNETTLEYHVYKDIFANKKYYYFKNVTHERGVNDGNGWAVITFIKPLVKKTFCPNTPTSILFSYFQLNSLV